jgi:transaldolase/glucose-6-phosphate isomerase
MLGFGPRFLHSTGQLQKGGPDSGLFLQLTAEPAEDLRIGKRAITFGTLQRAQAMSDYEVLIGRGRKVMWLHMPGVDTLDRIVESVP